LLSVGAVGTFALGWLLPRLEAFEAANPGVDLRLTTNNNRVDIAEEGLDFAIRFGDGAWHGTEAVLLFAAPLTVLCDEATAARLGAPEDLAGETLLRSYRGEDWPTWFEAAGVETPPLVGPVFDSAALMVEAALAGRGVALAPARMFEGKAARPFDVEVDLGGYWLTRLKSKRPTPAMAAFESWIREAAATRKEAGDS
jgi:LysR family transcriptional regulator of beta-lactamase